MDRSKKKITRVTIIYWLMLTYIVVALAWWFISLEKQNIQVAEYRQQQLHLTIDSTAAPRAFLQQQQLIEQTSKRATIMHVSEGLFFLLLILLSAVFVFRTVRNEIRATQQQQNFMMAVTHELKTPIAVAQLNLETLQKHKLDAAKQEKLIKASLDEISRLHFLTNNILIASQLDGGRYQRSNDEMNLSDMVYYCIADFEKRFPGSRFDKHIEPEIDIVGDPLLLQLMVNNILENAIKYAPKNSLITVLLNQFSEKIILAIKDEGPGIKDAEKKLVFDKFYRVGTEETRKTKGTGLGLYLCKKIASDHNADITVTNNKPTGCIFEISFKK